MRSPDTNSDTTPPPSPRRRFSPPLRAWLSVAAIVLLMLWILGVFRHGVIQPGKAPLPASSAAGLVTRTVAPVAMDARTEVPGTVQAERLATVTSRVVANIVEVRVTAGQPVAAGQVLMVLDDRDLRTRLQQAQDGVQGAEASLAQAKSDFDRDQPLFEQRVITPYDFEHTQTNLKIAQAALHRLQQAEREAQVNLTYAVIRSPFTGVVVDRLANVGDLAAPGRPLVKMYEQGRLWLEASVPEDLMRHVRLGDTLALGIEAVGGEARGRVVEIVPSSDPTTRTFTVRVRLDETKDLVPGMFGRLFVPTQADRVLAVPASAIVRAGQLTMVDVAAGGRVERRTVQLGRPMGDQVEVLSGLAPGEAVVLRGRPAGGAK